MSDGPSTASGATGGAATSTATNGVASNAAAALPVVVCLHAGAGSGAQWRSLAARLDGRFQVVAPELHGLGGSARGPAALDAACARLSVVAADACRAAGVARAHLVGHSFGGVLALRLALAPDAATRFASLALVEPVAFNLLRDGDPADLRLLDELRALEQDFAALLARGAVDEAARAFFRYWGAPAALRGARAVLPALLAEVLVGWQAILADPLKPDDYRRIALPSLMIVGELSPPAARRMAERLAALLPGCRRVDIAGARHLAPVTHPDRVNEAIAAHLAAAERAANGPGAD